MGEKKWVGFRRAIQIVVAVFRVERLLRKAERLSAREDFQASARLASRARVIALHKLGLAHSEHADALARLAVALSALGDLAGAEEHGRQALEIRRLLYGESHPDVAGALTLLAYIYNAGNNDAEAERLARKAREMLAGRTDVQPQAVFSLANLLGQICLKTGRLQEGKALCEEAWNGLRAITKDRDPYLVEAARGLAEAQRLTFNYPEAECLIRWCLEIQGSRGGERSLAYAKDLHTLSLILSGQGQYKESLEASREVVGFLGRALGEESLDYGLALLTLASALVRCGDLRQAAELADRGVTILRSGMQGNDPRLAFALCKQAEIRENLGDDPAAEILYQEVISRWPSSVLEKSTALMALAEHSFWRADFAQGESYLREAVKIIFQSLGPQHPYYASCLQSLAKFYQFTGSPETAEFFYRQALEILRKAL